MIEQPGSDPRSGKDDSSDDDIIDLTDEVAPGGDSENDDMIELTLEAESAPLEDDDIMELSEEASPDGEVAFDFNLDTEAGSDEEDSLARMLEAEPAGEEEILELSEETAEEEELSFDLDMEEGDEEKPLDLTLEAGGPSEEDASLLALLEEAEPAEEELSTELDTQKPAEEEAPLELTLAAEPTEEEDIFELADETEPAGEEKPAFDFGLEEAASEEELGASLEVEATPVETLAASLAPEMAPETPSREDLAFAEDMGIRLDPARNLSLESLDEEITAGLSETLPAMDVPREVLEAAIERVIEKKLGGRIDALLSQAIETAVKAEIVKLKRVLSADYPDI